MIEYLVPIIALIAIISITICGIYTVKKMVEHTKDNKDIK